MTEPAHVTQSSAHAIEIAKDLARMTTAFRMDEPMLVQPELDDIAKRLVALQQLCDELFKREYDGVPAEMLPCPLCGAREVSCRCEPYEQDVVF